MTKVLIIVYTFFDMKIQQFNPKMISITQLRRDIDALEEVLAQEEEAFVVRNQDLLFVAIAPEKYQNLRADKRDSIKKAAAAIEKMRHNFGRAKGAELVSDYVARMREQRIKKWRR